MRKLLWLLFILNSLSKALPQTEEIFWWWDDGLITYEQVEEFLVVLNNQDEEGFCFLKEAYLNQKCSPKIEEAKAKKYKYIKANWKAEIDSLTQLKKQKIQMNAKLKQFHLEIRSDSIFSLTYQREKNTAILGHLTYSHLNTGIQLQPMNGYYGRYYHHNKTISFLFTSLLDFGIQGELIRENQQFHLHLYSIQKKNYILCRYQNKVTDIVLWYDLFKKQPLARIRLKTPQKKNTLWEWQSEMFIHSKDSLSIPLDLAKSIAQSTFWSVQHQKFNFLFLELSLSEKVNIPIDTGSVVASVQASIKASGSNFFIESSWTCRDAREKCAKPQLRIHSSFKPQNNIELFSKIYKQSHSFSGWLYRPQLLFGITLNPEQSISLKNEILFPEKASKKNISWRQSTQIRTNSFLSFLCHFEFQIQNNFHFMLYRAGISVSLTY